MKRFSKVEEARFKTMLGEPPPLNRSVLRSLRNSRRCIPQCVIVLKDEGSHPHFLGQTGRIFAIDRCPTPRSTESMGLAHSASHCCILCIRLDRSLSLFKPPSGSDTSSTLVIAAARPTSNIQPRHRRCRVHRPDCRVHTRLPRRLVNILSSSKIFLGTPPTRIPST